jgi:chromosome segregation ATPase
MAVQAITKEGRESLTVLTSELKKGLPALEAELSARLDKKMDRRLEEASENFQRTLDEEKEEISKMVPSAKQISALKGENTKLRKQLADLEARVDGMAATLAAGNVGAEAPLSVAAVNARVTKLRDVVAPWMQEQERVATKNSGLLDEHEKLIQKLKTKYKRYLA